MASTQRPRDSVIISTKACGYNNRYDWFRDSGEGTQLTKAQICESVDKSLARLNTDYVDLFQFHWPERSVGLTGMSEGKARSREMASFETQVEAIGELLQAGKIRHWGLSNENVEGVEAFLKVCKELGVAQPVCMQNAYNLLQRGDEQDLILALGHDAGMGEKPEEVPAVGYLSYSPLSGGVLSGKYSVTRQKKVAGDKPKRSRLKLVKGYEESFLQSSGPAAVEAYVQVAKKHGITPSQLSIGLCNSRAFVTSTVVGAPIPFPVPPS